MSDSAAIIAATDACTTPNYARTPIVFVRGQGCRLFDADGKSYLDMLAGLGVCSLGHGHAALTSAIQDQAGRLIHTSNLYYHEPGARLAERLVELTFADRVFFCNSGAEANEAAIKMARRFNPGRHEIVALHRSFHGRTLAALAATGQPNLQEGFGPLPAGFVHVEHDDVTALADAVNEKTAAVLVEPILGEGGVVAADADYLRQLRRICDDAGALLVLDEVQTGNGRTGKLYAHEHVGVVPDIMTTAKGLAGGLPIGAVLASEAVGSTFVPGSHGSTFGANPVAAAAALVVLDTLTAGVIDNAATSGEHLRSRLLDLAASRNDIVEVRGQGLMVGVEFSQPTAPIVAGLLDAGVLANATAGNVLRFLPPLTITNAEIDEGIDALAGVLV